MRFIYFCLLLTCFACKNEPKAQNSQNEPEPTVAVDSLKVYNFEEFESLLHKKDDQVYVINFWATWCAPCIKELPSFEKLNKVYATSNVEVILVSLDFPNQYESKLKPYISSKGLKSKVVALNDPDSNSWIPKVNRDWSGAIPATLIYNKNERKFYEQSFEYPELEKALIQFLN